MAQHLVLQKFEGVASTGETFRFDPGEIIDDTRVPVTELNTSGLATIPYVAASMATMVTRFNESFGADDPDQGMAEQLVYAGLVGGGILSGAGNPNGSVTGLRGQRYFDTALGDFYTCTSSPSGTVWILA